MTLIALNELAGYQIGTYGKYYTVWRYSFSHHPAKHTYDTQG